MARPETLQDALPGLWRMTRYFWPYMRPHRGLLTGSFLALLAQVGLQLLEPWPLKFVFDNVLVPSQPQQPVSLPLVGSPGSTTLLTLSVVAIIAATGLRAVTGYISTVGFALAGNRVVSSIRGDFYRHLQGLSLSFHTRARTGDLTMRVISDTGMLRDVAVTAVMPLLANVLVLIGMLIMMLWMQWQLALLALAVTPLFWLRTTRLSHRIQQVSREQRGQEGMLASTASESIAAIRVIQALSLEQTFANVFERSNSNSLRDGVRAKRLEASLERTVDVLIALSTGLVVWFGARLVLRGQLTPGELLVFLAYLKNAFKPARDFAKYTGRLAKASAAGERVIELFDETPDIQDRPDAVLAPPLRGRVEFDAVSFAYNDAAVLSNVSFTVEPGQRVSVAGGSGNGKSTLVSLLLRLYDPQDGCIRIDGLDVCAYTLASLRAQISVVLQDNLLFAASVRDNIAYGRPDATEAEIEAAARLANAHEFILALPDGYETILGERGVTLSGGQRQRIAIARAAIRQSPILILDEPTTGLDEENEQMVLEALTRLMRGRTTFVISHDLRLAARSDVILYLDGGRLVEFGTHDDLVLAGGRYARMYHLQLVSDDNTAIDKEPSDVLVLCPRVRRPRSIATGTRGATGS